MTIGHLAPVTGYLSDFAPAAGKAADLAGAQINQAIDEVGADQTVTIKQKDDRTDQRAGVRAARELVTADKAPCLVGSWSAAVSERVAKEVAIKDQVLQISPAATDDALSELADGGLFNRTVTPDSLQGPALADVIEDNLGGAQGRTSEHRCVQRRLREEHRAHLRRRLAAEGRAGRHHGVLRPEPAKLWLAGEEDRLRQPRRVRDRRVHRHLSEAGTCAGPDGPVGSGKDVRHGRPCGEQPAEDGRQRSHRRHAWHRPGRSGHR